MPTRGRPRGFDKVAALEKAMNVFWSHGFQGASMAELTKAMNLNAPSVYAAFGSKEELFRAAVAHYHETAGTGIWDGIPDTPTARAAIEHVLYRSAESFTAGPSPRGCLIVLSALQSDGPHPEICDELMALRLTNIDTLEARLARGVADGELPAEFDCRAVATYYATVQHGMSIQARDGASRDVLNGIADCALAGWTALANR